MADPEVDELDDDTIEIAEDADDGGLEGDSDALEDGAVDGQPGEEAVDGGEDNAQRTVDGQKDGSSQVKLPKRNQEMIRLRERAQAAERDRDSFRQRLDTLERQQAGRQTEQEAALERERVALMSPDEKIEHFRQKDRQEFDRRFQMLQFQQADASDKVAFDTLCARNKAYVSVQDRVEELLANERRAGSNPRREVVAKYLIGEMAINRAAQAAGKQRKNGAAAVARQVAKPSGAARSDTGQQTRSPSDRAARAKRLENVEL